MYQTLPCLQLYIQKAYCLKIIFPFLSKYPLTEWGGKYHAVDTHWKSFTNIYVCPSHTSQKAQIEVFYQPGKILSEVTVTAKCASKKGFLFPEIIKFLVKTEEGTEPFLTVKQNALAVIQMAQLQHHCGTNSSSHMGYLSK